MMNDNELFREATLRICGNLEIDEALHELLLFLKEVMPVSNIYLQHYDEDYQAMRTIAHASESGYGKLDLLTPLSETSREKAANAPEYQDAFLITDPMSFPVSQEMTAFHGIQSSSVIVMTLRTGNATLGYLILVSEGNDIFDNSHRSFVELLKEPLVISMSNALKHKEVVKLNDLLADDNRYLHGELRRLSGDEIVGARFGLRDVTRMIRQVAMLDSPVLLLGETGTGKEVLAQAIHSVSTRADKPFVGVNVAAIPDNLLEAEFFGVAPGAYTGADRRTREGKFQLANGGTLFLDEVGDMPLPLQAKLLRALQEGEIEPLGSNKVASVDVRVIAATSRNLEEMGIIVPKIVRRKR